jgi:heterodisulfide reductase subunit A-like polyferredoxin
VGVCPYDAREIDEEKEVAKVIEVLCQGCGACAAICPNAATKQVGFAKEEIMTAVDSLT